MSHCVKTRSEGCNADTTRLKRVVHVIPLQPALALMSSANNVITRDSNFSFFLFFGKAKTREFSLLYVYNNDDIILVSCVLSFGQALAVRATRLYHTRTLQKLNNEKNVLFSH